MISISTRQMRLIESAQFRSNCLDFIRLELELMDTLVHAESISKQFDILQTDHDLSNRGHRLEMTMELLAKFAFPAAFTKHSAERPGFGTDASIYLMKECLIQHGYNPSFLWRKSWIQ